MEDGPDEGRVIGLVVEILDHDCLCHIRNVVHHGLKALLEREEGLVVLALDGFEVPGLCWFVGKRLNVCNERIIEVIPIVDAVAREMLEQLKCILPEHDR